MSQFELFELILLLKEDKRFPVEQFEATVSQSTVPSPPLSTEVTFGGQGDLSVCPLVGLTGAHESLVSNWRGDSQGSPQGLTLSLRALRALLLRGTSVRPG